MATYRYTNRRTLQVINLSAPDPVLDGSPLWTLQIVSGPSAPGSPPPSGGGGGSGGVDTAAVQAIVNATLAVHVADTTDVHGFVDTTTIEDTADVAAAILVHAGAADAHADRAWATGTLVAKNTLVYYAADYGARADGTDATPGINAALSAAPPGSTVLLPTGTLLVQPTSHHMIVVSKKNITLAGTGRDGTIIKVKDAAGNYDTVISDGRATAPYTDIGGLTVRDLTIDQNAANNPISDVGPSGPLFTGDARYAVRVFSGTDITIDNVRVINADSAAAISVRGTGVKRLRVLNSLFDQIGPGARHAHATVYFDGDGVTVEGCEFVGAGQAAVTAVETHGPNQKLIDNTIRGYFQGFSVSGQAGVTSRNIHVRGNTFYGVAQGVLLRVMDFTGLVGEAMTETIVESNIVEINPDGWVIAPAQLRAGVLLDPASSGVARHVRISDNTIYFRPFAQPAAAADIASCGVVWQRTATVTEGTIEVGLEISRNQIKGSLGPGVFVDAGIELKRLRVDGNTINDPGQGTTDVQYRCGVRVASATAMGRDLLIARNVVIDNAGTHVLDCGVNTQGWAAVLHDGRLVDNSARCADGVAIAVHKGHTAVAWYAKHVMGTYVDNVGVWLAGSSVTATADGLTRTQTATPSGSTWTLADTTTVLGRRGNLFVTGKYYSAPDIRGAVTVQTMTLNTAYFAPFYATEAKTFDRIGITVNTAASGSTVRLGIYADNGHGAPTGGPLLDAGTVPGTASGSVEATIDYDMTPGLYWLVAVAQGGTPILAFTNTPTPQVGADTLAQAISGRAGYTQTGVTGALGIYTGAGATFQVPVIALRAATASTGGGGGGPGVPPATDFPTAANTGYLGALSALTAFSGTSINSSGTYDHRLFDASAAPQLSINASNVTLTNCVIRPGSSGSVGVFGSNVVLRDCTILRTGADPYIGEAAVFGNNYTLTRCRIYSGGDCVFVNGNNIIVEDCYLEAHPATPAAHTDGIQLFENGSNVVIDHNTITMRGTPSTAPINWCGAPGPGVEITNNLLVGGPYTLKVCENSGDGAVITGNVFARGEGTPTFIPDPNGPTRTVTFTGNQLADVSSDYSTITNLAPYNLS